MHKKLNNEYNDHFFSINNGFLQFVEIVSLIFSEILLEVISKFILKTITDANINRF
jgi:hypothetical protein